MHDRPDLGLTAVLDATDGTTADAENRRFFGTRVPVLAMPEYIMTATDLAAMERDPETGEFIAEYHPERTVDQ